MPPSQISDGASVLGLGNILLIVSVVTVFVMVLLWSIRKMGKHDQAENASSISNDRIQKLTNDVALMTSMLQNIQTQNDNIQRQQTVIKNAIDLTRMLINLQGRHGNETQT